MKTLLLAALAVCAVTASAELKIGTVEMLKLVKNHPRYESNKQLLSDTEKDYTRKLDAQKSEMDKLQEQGQKLAEQYRNPMLAAKAKGDLERQMIEIQQKLAAGQQRIRSEMMRSQQELQDLEGRLLKSVTEDLRGSIGRFAKEGGYDMVLDSTAAPFSKPEFDVTDGVLRTMGIDPEQVRAKEENEGK